MSEGTTRTPNGVSGEIHVQTGVDLKTNYEFAVVELNMQELAQSKDGANGANNSASGAAAKGGSDIAMVIGAEAKTAFINPRLDAINLGYEDPEKVDKSKFDSHDSREDEVEDNTKNADDNIRN